MGGTAGKGNPPDEKRTADSNIALGGTAGTGNPPDGDRIERLKAGLEAADAVLIGAGAGLSAAAGLAYDGARFRTYFSDFGAKYGFSDLYSGGFYPFPTPEEYWAFWSRSILINRYADAPGSAYGDLLSLVKGRDYFVLTTNVDQQFWRSGFDGERLFATQGDYGSFQCSVPCCNETFPNEEAVRRMVSEQTRMRVPSARLPKCPRCGEPMTLNLRVDGRFVEDGSWHTAAKRYADFLEKNAARRLLLLELGVGYNTPGIIKYPFWRILANNPAARYASINRGEAYCPPALSDRAILLDADIGLALRALQSC